MSINSEGLYPANSKQKCDVSCMQETHREPTEILQRINGMDLVSEIHHDTYGSAMFIQSDCACDTSSISYTRTIEIIQAQSNGMTVTSCNKHQNEKFIY